MTPHRRRRFRLIAAPLVMVDFLRRIFIVISSGARPIDGLVLLVDALVLAIILYFEIGGKAHQRKMRRCQDSIFDHITAGQNVSDSKPNPPTLDDPSILEWERNAKTWIQETAESLRRESPKARELFLRGTDPVNFEKTRNPEFWALTVRDRVQHLQSIMDRPEMYF